MHWEQHVFERSTEPYTPAKCTPVQGTSFSQSSIGVGCMTSEYRDLGVGAMHDAGDAAGNIRVWDLTANACSCELVPEVGTPVRCTPHHTAAHR